MAEASTPGLGRRWGHVLPVGLSEGVFKGEHKPESSKMVTAHQSRAKSIRSFKFLPKGVTQTTNSQGREEGAFFKTEIYMDHGTNLGVRVGMQYMDWKWSCQ